MKFKRHKISGISFHHRSNHKKHNNKYKINDFFNLNDLYLQIKKDTPNLFTNADIKRFLKDHGRNEINSQISMCIDFTTKWSSILNIIERCFQGHSSFHSESLEKFTQDSEVSVQEVEVEIYLLIKKTIWLWKHNLHILQMSAQAQI